MKIKREESFAVVIDYQERILPAMREKEALLGHSVKFLEGLKALGIPVFLTQQYTKGLGQTVEAIRAAAGTEDYTEKLAFSAYSDLEEKVPAKEERPTVLIYGIESHVCVLQTALDFKAAGYHPVLPADCVSSRKQQDYELALIRAQQEGIALSTYEALLFELLERAGTDTAKAIQKIVK